MTKNTIRERLTAAGVSYPLNWDDMGSSERDLWEDRQIARLERERPPARLYSSGKHAALNSQPWALIEDDMIDGELHSSVVWRFASRAEAEESLAESNEWATSPAHVEFDPNPLDAAPLARPGNPILADCRVDGTVDAKSIEWWRDLLEYEHFDDERPHVLHAYAVITRYNNVFGGVE